MASESYTKLTPSFLLICTSNHAIPLFKSFMGSPLPSSSPSSFLTSSDSNIFVSSHVLYLWIPLKVVNFLMPPNIFSFPLLSRFNLSRTHSKVTGKLTRSVLCRRLFHIKRVIIGGTWDHIIRERTRIISKKSQDQRSNGICGKTIALKEKGEKREAQK